MKVLKPFYYNDFKCIADKCIDNCCHMQWQITIDEKTYKKYRKLKGTWGKKINNNITRIRKNNSYLNCGKIKLKECGCSLLDEEGFCSIHAQLGEGYLSNTCKMYPRNIAKYNNIYERNLLMSCPEVARYLIKHKGDFYFNMDEEELSDLDKDYIINKNYNENLYNLLWDARSLTMEIIQFKEIDIWKRIVFVKSLCDKVQVVINKNNYENYQTLLNNFRNEMVNFDTINSLDKITIVPNIKMSFTQAILQLRNNCGIKNKKYLNLIDEYNELVEKKNTFTLMIEIENEFNEILSKYNNVIENLLVYLIYKYFMRALYTKNLHREVNNVLISYAVIKMLLLARWYKNNKKLEEEDFMEIFYLFSREIEHSNVFLNKLHNNIKDAGYDSVAYMTILVH